MKKIIVLLILFAFLSSNVMCYADWQYNLNAANQEFKNDSDFKSPPAGYSSNNINTDVADNDWGGLKSGSSNSGNDIGHAFTYGDPYGYESSKTPSWRYVGKTINDDDFTNIYFPHDAWAGGFIEDRSWIREPWKQNLCKDNKFDVTNLNNLQKYRVSIIKGLEIFYGYALNGNYVNKDWENYVHILQPPTYSSQGIGKMWHISGGKVWYMTVPLAKFELTNPKPSPTPTSAPTTQPTATPIPNVDFSIKDATTSVTITDSIKTYDITPLSYGQNHQVKLTYTANIANVQQIEWRNPQTSEFYMVVAPNTSTTFNIIGAATGTPKYYDMTVRFSDGSSATKTHWVWIKEISSVPTPIVSPTPTNTPTPTPIPTTSTTPLPTASPAPLKPIAVLDCPTTVGAGQTFKVSGIRSYSQTGHTIVKWNIYFSISPDSSTITMDTQSSGDVKYLKTTQTTPPKILYCRLNVQDDTGLWSDSVVTYITVEEPEPFINMVMPQKTKELRKITVDLSNSGTTSDEAYVDVTPPSGHYTTGGIDWTASTVSVTKITSFPLDASDKVFVEYWDNNNARHIEQLTGQVLSGTKKYNIMGKKQMELKLTGIVHDIEGRTTEPVVKYLTIVRDAKPISDILYPTKTFRTFYNSVTGKYEGRFEVADLSYSPDDDYFEYRHFYYREDKDDDGIFVGETMNQVNNPTNNNIISIIYDASNMYNCQCFVEVKEALPPETTIIEFIAEEDYKISVGYLKKS